MQTAMDAGKVGAHERALEIHAAFNAADASAPWLVCDRH